MYPIARANWLILRHPALLLDLPADEQRCGRARALEATPRDVMSRLQPDNEDYRWLLDALGGPGDGEPAEAFVRPSADHPELFIPLASPQVAAASLRRYHDGRSHTDRAKTVVALAGARSGLLRFAPGELVRVGPFALVEQLAVSLNEPELHVAVTLGPRRRNRKPVLQLIRPDGSSVGFAKIGWSPFTRSLVGNEADWLQRFDGKTPAGVEIPRVLVCIEDAERLVVVTSPLITSPLAGLAGRLTTDQVIALARGLGTERTTFESLPLLDTLRSGRVGQLIDIETMTARHSDASLEIGSWHGDLTPWNTATASGKTLVWDWEFADDGRPVGFDLLHNAFELVRRSAKKNEANALASVCAEADSILSPIGQPSDPVVDLYLCELIQREARLRGEGWDPTDLGPLESHAAALLNERLA